MSEPVKIAIVLEGGMVSAVLSAGVPVEFVVVDYDVEGCGECGSGAPEEGRVVDVPQDNGEAAPAYVTLSPERAEISGEFVMGAHERFGAPEPIDCPVCDPDCLGGNGDCHDACEPPEFAVAARFADRDGNPACASFTVQAITLDAAREIAQRRIEARSDYGGKLDLRVVA